MDQRSRTSIGACGTDVERELGARGVAWFWVILAEALRALKATVANPSLDCRLDYLMTGRRWTREATNTPGADPGVLYRSG